MPAQLVPTSGERPFLCPLSTTRQATPPTPHVRWKQGARHALFRKRPGTEKEAGWVLSFLVRFRAASAAAIRAVPSASPAGHRASLLPARLPSTEVPCGCEEVRVGRRRGSGTEVPKAPTPGGGEGADSFVLFALRLHMPCHLSVPLLLSCHREVTSFGEQKAPAVCSMPP